MLSTKQKSNPETYPLNPIPAMDAQPAKSTLEDAYETLSTTYQPLCAVRRAARALEWPRDRRIMDVADAACGAIEVIVGASPERRAQSPILAFHERLLDLVAMAIVDAACCADDVPSRPEGAQIARDLIAAFSTVTDAAAQIAVYRRRYHSPALQLA